MKTLRPLLFLTAALLLAGSSHAGKPQDWARNLEPAQAALSAKDYGKAYPLYLRQARGRDNGLAQFVVGMFYREGWGRPKNPVAACTWFEKAAQKRIPAGENHWGDCLAQGIGRPADIAAALAWYDKAAQHGHIISACTAADYYLQGKGVEKDLARGLALCTAVAKANAVPAMLKLASYYQEGVFLPQDLSAARYWYQQAAELRSAEAQFKLGVMLAQGEGGEADLNAALFWLETAASQGYAPAYLPTAVLYANAPVQAETGALAPEHLAKVYLWNAAAKACNNDPALGAEIHRIDALVALVMPAAWRPDLDKKVAEHLALHPALDPAQPPDAAAPGRP